MVYEPYRRAQTQQPLSRHERLRGVLKALGLSKDAEKRLKWIIYWETTGERSAARTARYFGIGVSTFHKWHRLFDETNLRTLESGSRAPKKRRGREASFIKDKRVIALRKEYPYWGKMKLKTMYESKHGEEITSDRKSVV